MENNNAKIVDVVFTRDDLFPFQEGLIVPKCELLSPPENPGQPISFRKDGIQFQVNPYCREFAGIFFPAEEPEQDYAE